MLRYYKLRKVIPITTAITYTQTINYIKLYHKIDKLCYFIFTWQFLIDNNSKM